MTDNEIRKLSWDTFKAQPQDQDAIDLALAAAQLERQRIVAEIKRAAKQVDAKVATPDLWVLANYIEKILL